MDWFCRKGELKSSFYSFNFFFTILFGFFFKNIIYEFSRAIMRYLMDKYAKDDSLYPKDVKTRAIVNARLDFDCGTLWPRLIAAYVSFHIIQEKKRKRK